MRSFERVYLDPPGENDRGTFYDRAYEPGSGKTRHALGFYTVIKKYVITKRNITPMLAVRLFFDSGEKATGKCRARHPYQLDAYLVQGKRWDDPRPQ
jgi:hypothetical protein